MQALHLDESSQLRRAWVMLIWLFAAQVAVAFLGRSLAPLGPLIEADLDLSKAQIGLLPGALFLGQSLASLPAGYWADRFGTRTIVLWLTLLLGLFYLGVAASTSFALILFLVTLGGCAYGTMHPTTNRGIVYWFPQQRRGTAMGIKQMGVTTGSALSSLLLLPIGLAFGWRIALVVGGLLLIAVGLSTYFFYRDAPGSQRLASGGNLIATLGALFRHKPLLVLSLATMGLNGAQMSLNTYLVFYVHEWQGYSLVVAGMMLVASEVGGSAGRLLWGVISDRLFRGRRIPVLITIALMTAFLSLVTAYLPPGMPVVLLAALSVLFGFSIAGFNGMWMNAASESVPPEISGLASGVSLSIGTLGVVIGPPLFGWTVDHFQGYTVAWLALAVIMGVVIALLLLAERLQLRARAVRT